MRWSTRSAVVLAGILVAAFGVAGADGAGVVRSSVRPPLLAGRLGGLARMPSLANSFSELNAVFCTSPSNCWAVGEQQASGTAPTLNQMLRWNGTKWRPFPVPQPGGTAMGDSNALFSVRCLNSRDCWAVGFFLKNGADLDEALHWNGAKWTRIPTPTPGGILKFDVNELFGISCLASADCWAVGDFGSNHVTANQALHWNGIKWSHVSTPDPAGLATGDVNILAAIRCTSASSCLADGQYGTSGIASTTKNQVLRWNGKKWSRQTTPNPGGTAAGDANELFGLACSSSVSCWAVGGDGKEILIPSVNEILHWNGRKWFTTKAPDPATGTGAVNVLAWDVCLSSSDCWAVGYHGHEMPGMVVIRNDTLHWNGTKWSHVSSPNPGGTTQHSINVLEGIRCTSEANCWAVGFRYKGGNFVDQILHWNGRKWRPVSS